MNRNILFISNGIGIIKKGIKQSLTAAGFRVIDIPDEPDRIIVHRKDADMILYYPETGDDSHIGITMNILGEICQDDNKELCLIGDNSAIPTIFLTCKNDREHVFNILEYRPDGYLLKSSRKDTILDVIRRFFAESIFKLTVKAQ
ncbi:MAG: hypothetical protein K5929_04315 [Lachnospiraceae bacterium]|nr:hypothetical protein [Lachnospiraceae bacterium]